MKRILYVMLALSMFLISCGKDDGPIITHEMGDWTLEGFILINLPAGYAKNEGRVFDLNGIFFGGAPYESYKITISPNSTYSRRSNKVNALSNNDDGTWALKGDLMTLTNSNGDEEEYRIEKNESDLLRWSTESQFGLIEDAIADTLSQSYVTGLTNEQFTALFTTVTLDLVYAFKRQ